MLEMRHTRIDPHTSRMRQLIEASPGKYRDQPNSPALHAKHAVGPFRAT
ncbi:hypothetical protein [Nocardia gamkensis]